MVNNLELIEAYFNEELTTEQKTEFERRITDDPGFADETAFYLSSRQAAAGELEENRARLRGIYEQYKGTSIPHARKQATLRKLWPLVAAAAVLAGIIFGWQTFFQPVSPAQLADKFITSKFQKLSVEMGEREDSVQKALHLYNDGKRVEALEYFESMAVRDTSYADAKKYAGIVALRMEQYDKAIQYFTQLSKHTLHANPGTFYHALTLMKRNQPGDTETAKQLLQKVVHDDLDEKEMAEKWLKKW